MTYKAFTEIRRKYYKYGTTPNGSIIGTLTNNDGVISGFSASNYLIPNKTLPDWRNSEWVIKFKISSSGTGSLIGENTASSFDIPLVYVSNSSKIGFNGGQNWGGTGTTTLSTNTWYYVKLVVDSTQTHDAVLYLSTDGQNYSLELSSSFLNPTYSESNKLVIGSGYIGGSAAVPLSGEIDLTKSYIKVNNNMWWSGTVPVESTSSDYDFYKDVDAYNVLNNSGYYAFT